MDFLISNYISTDGDESVTWDVHFVQGLMISLFERATMKHPVLTVYHKWVLKFARLTQPGKKLPLLPRPPNMQLFYAELDQYLGLNIWKVPLYHPPPPKSDFKSRHTSCQWLVLTHAQKTSSFLGTDTLLNVESSVHTEPGGIGIISIMLNIIDMSSTL